MDLKQELERYDLNVAKYHFNVAACIPSGQILFNRGALFMCAVFDFSMCYTRYKMKQQISIIF